MSHLPPAHHETRKHILQTKQDKGKTIKTVLDLNSSLAKSMTHHNQTKEMTTWFLSFINPEGLSCGDLLVGVVLELMSWLTV
jgi:hypothetical protein